MKNIPQELKDLNQWVCWRMEKRKNKNTGEEKETKIPINPHTGKEAKTNNPKTWGSLNEAIQASKRFNGIGFVFTNEDPFCGIDLDHCRDLKTKEITTEAKKIIEQFSSYTEISQSGSGLHILIRAKLDGAGRKRNNQEIYDSGRYFVVTGNHLPEAPKIIEERQSLAENFWESLSAPKTTLKKPSPQSNYRFSLCDDEIIEKAKSAKNGDKFNRLWSGNYEEYSSQSEADLALCSILAFYTQDHSEIDKLFRQSGLYREEWEKNASKRNKTINKALAGLTDTYKPNKEHINTREEVIEAIPKKLDIPIPIEKIHPLFLAYSSEFEGKTEAPLEYILSSFLVSISGAIGNKVFISSGLDCCIKPNLYMMLIGDSTFLKKTTSLNYGMKTLRDISKIKKREFIQQNECFKHLKESGEGVPPPKPKDESFIYPDDLTFEQCVAKMQDKPDGVFVLSELGAFLARMESGQASGLKEMLTSLYDGKAPYSRETKTSGCFLIENSAPSLIGASTFQWLQNHLKDGDLLSGFLARFCYVVRRSYPQMDIPFQEKFELPEAWQQRFKRIIELSLDLKLSQEAKESFASWYSTFKKSIQEEESFLHSPLGRLKDETCHKIAMINHVLDLIEPSFNRFYTDEKIIEKRSYELAYPWIEFFAGNVRSCYMELTQKLNFVEMKIIETIKKRGKESNGFKVLARSEILKYVHLPVKDFTELAQTLIAKQQLSEIKSGKYCFYQIKL